MLARRGRLAYARRWGRSLRSRKARSLSLARGGLAYARPKGGSLRSREGALALARAEGGLAYARPKGGSLRSREGALALARARGGLATLGRRAAHSVRRGHARSARVRGRLAPLGGGRLTTFAEEQQCLFRVAAAGAAGSSRKARGSLIAFVEPKSVRAAARRSVGDHESARRTLPRSDSPDVSRREGSSRLRLAMPMPCAETATARAGETWQTPQRCLPELIVPRVGAARSARIARRLDRCGDSDEGFEQVACACKGISICTEAVSEASYYRHSSNLRRFERARPPAN